MADTGLESSGICLVDDEKKTLRAMTRTLNMAGYANVQSFCSWKDARAYLAETHATLLMLDILMPGITGEEALMEARSRWPRMPVVMVTGVQDISTAVSCMKKGASDYLTKPLDGQQLVEYVKTALSLKLPGAAKPAIHLQKMVCSSPEEAFLSVSGFHPSRLTLPVSIQDTDRAMITQFIEYIRVEEHYSDPEMSLANIAVQTGYNTSYLSRLVNQYWGMNFRTFLNSIRLSVFIEESRKNTSLPFSLEGIAKSVGFNRPSTFYTAFKDRFGMTPARWLKS